MAVLSGLVYSFQFTPSVYIQDHYLASRNGSCASRFSVPLGRGRHVHDYRISTARCCDVTPNVGELADTSSVSRS